MIKPDDSLDQLRVRKTMRSSTTLVQLQCQPPRGSAARRGQLPGVLQRRNLIHPGRVVPVFLHREDRHGHRGVEGSIEHMFDYSTQPVVCHSLCKRLAGDVGSPQIGATPRAVAAGVGPQRTVPGR